MKKLILILLLLIPSFALGVTLDDANLEAYYDMEDDGASLGDDKSTATTTVDLTNENTVTRSAHSGGTNDGTYAADFVSANNESLAGSAIGISAGTDYSVCLWTYSTNTNVEDEIIVMYDGTENGMYMQYYYNDFRFFHYDNWNNCDLSPSAANVSNSTWAHFCLVYDASADEGKWYKDGNTTAIETEDCSSDNDQDAATGDLDLGNGDLDGSLDGVAIFSRTLTTTEVNDIYTNGITAPAAGGSGQIIIISWLKNEFRKWARLQRKGHENAYWLNLYSRILNAIFVTTE